MTLHAHDKVVSALAVSSAAGLIATASHDKYVKLWKWLYCFFPLTKLVCLLHYVYPEILSRFSTDTFVAVYISLQSALATKEVFRSWPREVNQMMSTFASKLTLLHTKSGWQCSYRVLVQTYKRCKFFFLYRILLFVNEHQQHDILLCQLIWITLLKGIKYDGASYFISMFSRLWFKHAGWLFILSNTYSSIRFVEILSNNFV